MSSVVTASGRAAHQAGHPHERRGNVDAPVDRLAPPLHVLSPNALIDGPLNPLRLCIGQAILDVRFERRDGGVTVSATVRVGHVDVQVVAEVPQADSWG
jgi:hypothetical protein